jgi:hypothetical protein
MKTVLPALLIASLCVAACAGPRQNALTEVGVAQVDPRRMPTEIVLYQPVPVLGVRLDATEAGYAATTFRAAGAPSNSLDQSRDVVVQATDPAGRPIQTVTVDNPRAVHTVGSRNPAQAVRPTGSVTVFFPNPDQVRSISVTVLRGPNEGFRREFKVDPAKPGPASDKDPTKD